MENLSNVTVVKSDGQMKKQKLKTWGFYISVVALPLIQFCIFYIGVNFNSFFMAFQQFKPNSMVVESWTFDNFRELYRQWSGVDITLKNALKTSLFGFGVNVLLGMTSGVLFSYYIFKKMPLYSFFKIVLFMPSIISSMVMTMAYQYFMIDGVTAIAEVFGKTIEPGYMFSTKALIGGESSIITRSLLSVVIYNVWVSFGTQILMYVGAMSGIPEGTIEAGQIDGVNAIREFWHIVLPSVWSPFVVFLTSQIAVIFTNQMSLMNFGAGTGVNTIGYHIFKNMERITRKAGNYPELTLYSALGIACSAIAIPITLGVRWLLTKFGPSEE